MSNESDSPVETDRAVVLGGHFEIHALDAGLAKARQRVQQQTRAQAGVAVFGSDAEVLDGAQPVLVADPLHGAAILGPVSSAGRVNHQPGRLGQEARLPHDLRHQPPAALELGQARKDVGIHLVAKAQILRLGKGVQQRLVPGEEIVVARHGRRRQVAPGQVDLHAETLEIGEIHHCNLSGSDGGVNCRLLFPRHSP